jgi:hypothetical protein
VPAGLIGAWSSASGWSVSTSSSQQAIRGLLAVPSGAALPPSGRSWGRNQLGSDRDRPNLQEHSHIQHHIAWMPAYERVRDA